MLRRPPRDSVGSVGWEILVAQSPVAERCSAVCHQGTILKSLALQKRMSVYD